MMPAPAVASAAAKSPARKPLSEVVSGWATGLTAANAPDAKNKGPLAWVREVEVPKLLEALVKEGYK